MSELDEIALSKRTLRERMKRTLAVMDSTDRDAASRAACDRISELPILKSAHAIMLYLPLPGEIDCSQLIEFAFRAGKIVGVPHVDWEKRTMQVARLTSLDPQSLLTDKHGVRLPRVFDEIQIESLEAVIVPGLAFDETGRRLGRGGGFYDRFLARLPSTTATIGLAFDCQVVPAVPALLHDAKVQFIATESRWIACG